MKKYIILSTLMCCQFFGMYNNLSPTEYVYNTGDSQIKVHIEQCQEDESYFRVKIDNAPIRNKGIKITKKPFTIEDIDLNRLFIRNNNR